MLQPPDTVISFLDIFTVSYLVSGFCFLQADWMDAQGTAASVPMEQKEAAGGMGHDDVLTSYSFIVRAWCNVQLLVGT
jgi:hypothetical protein